MVFAVAAPLILAAGLEILRAGGSAVDAAVAAVRELALAPGVPDVTVEIDRARRTATWTVKGPQGTQPTDIPGIEAAGAAWYPLTSCSR